jgi:hypothetical protein
MTNPRRRRTVVALVTFGFILLFQFPNLVRFLIPFDRPVEQTTSQSDSLAELQRASASGKMPPDEYKRRLEEIQREQKEQRLRDSNQTRAEVEHAARLINLVLPPGWLPLGAAELTQGRVSPALLGTLGLCGIGSLSLWRAYRTTLRLYMGQNGSSESKADAQIVTPGEPSRPRMVEWQLPWVSEYASAVAAAGLRSLIRAPEAKMMLLSPVIMVAVFGSLVLTTTMNPPGWARPLMASGAAAFVYLMAIQLVGNQFGYDRAGFRAFVLSPVPRREILLGKNLAAVPLVVGLSMLSLILVMCLYPLRPDHLVASTAQIISLFLLFCLLANTLSILAPVPVAAGSIQPSNVRFFPILMQMLFMMVFPVAIALTLIPLGVEILFAELGWVQGLPVAMILSIALLGLVWLIYRKALTWEGELLTEREQAILEVVTSTTE